MTGADMELLEELYAFCLARAQEKADGKHGHLDGAGLPNAQAAIEMLQHVRTEANADPARVTQSIDLLRLYALRDRSHPNYKPEWCIVH